MTNNSGDDEREVNHGEGGLAHVVDSDAEVVEGAKGEETSTKEKEKGKGVRFKGVPKRRPEEEDETPPTTDDEEDEEDEDGEFVEKMPRGHRHEDRAAKKV